MRHTFAMVALFIMLKGGVNCGFGGVQHACNVTLGYTGIMKALNGALLSWTELNMFLNSIRSYRS